MEIEILPAGPDCLAEYATVPIAFVVQALLQPVPLEGGLGGIALRQEPVQPPYLKDYDASEEGGPEAWARAWDLSSWRFFLARQGGRCVGAAAVAFGTPEVNLLDGREDLAVLWDIRVHPDFRGQGLGRRLFHGAADWARAQGCRLGAIHRHAYARHPELAHETMLLWYLDL